MSNKCHDRLARAASLGLAAACFVAGELSAHHSPAAFDLQQSSTIEGTVARYDWANPHVYIDVEVGRDDGSTDIWEVEAAWPASLVPLGWSRDTLKPGDPVTITGNPARRPGSHKMLGRSLRIAGRTLVMYVEPGTPVTNPSLANQDRTGMPAVEALEGTWQPLESDPLVLLAPELTKAPGPELTDRARAALDEGRLLMGDGAAGGAELEAARCVSQRPPLDMSFDEPKTFEVQDQRVVIRVAVVGDTQRIVYTGDVPAGVGARNRQGLSVGHWEGVPCTSSRPSIRMAATTKASSTVCP